MRSVSVLHHRKIYALWLKTRDRLSLYASGIGGAEGLRNILPSDWEDVFFGFCREEENSRGYYALIAYVPETVSGVRRGSSLPLTEALSLALTALKLVPWYTLALLDHC